MRETRTHTHTHHGGKTPIPIRETPAAFCSPVIPIRRRMPAPPRASLFPLIFRCRSEIVIEILRRLYPSPSPRFRRPPPPVVFPTDARRYVSGLVRRQDREIARTIANKLLGILTARSTIISPDASLDYVTQPLLLSRVCVPLVYRSRSRAFSLSLTLVCLDVVPWRDTGSFSHRNAPDPSSISAAASPYFARFN